jgi:DNA-binding NtrC family response regulator
MVETPCILVIDDEVDICSFLHDVFTAEGYTVSTASDPEEGIQMVEKLKPDLVLLDLKMPGMSGIDVLREIKKIDESIAVIIMTGFGTMDTARAAMRLGAFDYITKPFDLPHLRALVKDALAYTIGSYVEQLKSLRGRLSDEQTAFLDALQSCRPQGACLWEVAVRAFLLGDTEFLADWMEQSSIPDEDKKNMARLIEILNDVIRRAQRKRNRNE